jgi:hypothetical protein
MASGHLTFLRAWRNNPNIDYDFNPDNWMQYYFNDLSILCRVEEFGKVLNLPRNLYHYTYRSNSISKLDYGNSATDEGELLIKKVENRRHDKDMDTLNRYFESVYDESLYMMEYDMNSAADQMKVSYVDSLISKVKSNILRELFFDWDLRFNEIDGDEDCVIFVIRTYNELLALIENGRISMCGGGVQIVIPNCYANQHFNDMLKFISDKYPFVYYIFNHCIVKLIK